MQSYYQKANFIHLDLHFGLAAQLGYQFLKPDSLRQFLVASGCRATAKWYSDYEQHSQEISQRLMKMEVTYCLSNCRPCRHVTLLFAAFNWASPSINSSEIKNMDLLSNMPILTQLCGLVFSIIATSVLWKDVTTMVYPQVVSLLYFGRV